MLDTIKVFAFFVGMAVLAGGLFGTVLLLGHYMR